MLKLKQPSIYITGSIFNETVVSIADPSNKYLLPYLRYYLRRIIIRLLLGSKQKEILLEYFRTLES